jgi:predicted Zn-dependent protease
LARRTRQDREEFIVANPDAPESADYAAELVSLKSQRAELALQSARARIEQNPTDLQLRFELGELLVEAEAWQEAIPELQKARQNPNVRMRAMSLLGRCFTVWLRASPEEHMGRVVAQGDTRPMAGHREAMEDLKRILAGRADFYAKADIAVDTGGQPLQGAFEALKSAVHEARMTGSATS